MNKLQSIFGAYASAAAMQAAIDASQDRFKRVFWQRYFRLGVPQTQLTYVTAIGRTRIEAAASVVSRDGATPLRSRAGIEKLNGEVPAIKVMKSLSESDYRNYLSLQALPISDQVKKQQLLNLMFGDVEAVVNSVNKRLDMMVLEGLSTGKITITADNNPDGIVTDEIGLLMKDEQFVKASKAWTDADATPLTDMKNVVKAAKDKGISFGKVLMSDSLFNTFIKNGEVTGAIKGFYNPGSNARYVATLDNINQYLVANRLPVIEIIDEVVAVEKDGVNEIKRPFKDENVVFVPDGQLGIIHNALAIEQIQAVPNVSYSQANNILVSKWFANEPFGEYTKAEFNAFPGFEGIDSTYILLSDQVAA